MYLSLQGNAGLGVAIQYFTSHQMTVCLPLNDTQKYDLVADINGSLQRISVKTSKNKKNSTSYEVGLRNIGGASGKSIVRKFNNKDCDYIFVLIGDNRTYLIPSNVVHNSNCIVVGGFAYSEYEVHTNQFSQFRGLA